MELILLMLTAGLVGAFQPPSMLARKRYDGYTVLSMTPDNDDALKVLHHLMITDVHVDFWRQPTLVGVEVHVMVSPLHLQRVQAILSASNIVYKTHVEDVQNLLTPMWNKIDSRSMQQVFNIDDFNTLEDIYAWMGSLFRNCRTGLICQMYNAGNSLEGRPINVFKISKPGGGRKAFYVDATIHGREWISTATTLKILYHLASGGDADAVALTDEYDWYIMPVVNPDGYSYTWTNDRLWRKNRRRHDGSFCYGVDLNRNFDFRWGTEGVGFNPCGEIYGGASGGSEPETAAVSADLVRLGSNAVAFLSVQAYGSAVSFPWGNTINYTGEVCERTDDFDDMMRVADATADAIQATYETLWSRGNSCELGYALTGNNNDFGKGAAGIKFSFVSELRGDNHIVDASNIPLSFEELWNGVVALNNAINA